MCFDANESQKNFEEWKKPAEKHTYRIILFIWNSRSYRQIYKERKIGVAQGREGDQGVGKRVYTRAQINLEVMGLVTVFIVVMVSHSKCVCTHQIVHVNYVQFTVCRKVAKENRGEKDGWASQAASPICSPGCKV